MKFDSAHQLVGNTPSLRLPVEPSDTSLHLKLEGLNPTGSVKDRACLSLILGQQEIGELSPGKTLLDASSGNMACAIAYFGKLMGFSTTLISSSKLTEDKRNFLNYYGAELHLAGDFTIEGNRLCRQMYEESPGQYCFLDQLHNWDNPKASYETLGPEILQDFPQISALVGSLGSGGSLFGAGRYLKQERPEIKVIAALAAPGTRIPGTAALDDGDYETPFIAAGFKEGVFDHTIKLDLEQAQRETLRLRDLGVFCGLQTGGVVHSAREAVHQFGITGDVVAISGDSGWKNMEKLIHL